VRRILGEAVAAASPRLGCKTLDELPAPLGLDPVAVGENDLALVQFSSGTTVEPKPVALSQRAVAAQVSALDAFWPRERAGEQSCVTWLPLYHDMGLIGCVCAAIAHPGTLTLLGPEVFVARPALWLRALSRYGATISVAPNFAYGLCTAKIRDADLEGVDLSRWRWRSTAPKRWRPTCCAPSARVLRAGDSAPKRSRRSTACRRRRSR
jgi:acyl-CoA synthetase (AMP-forming)/AMP-acid ligase II